MWRVLGAFGLVLGIASAGCSSGGDGGGGGTGAAGGAGGGGGTSTSGDALTCEWLKSADNCWQAAVDEIYMKCAPAEEGLFGDEDYLSCNYPNGDSDVYGSRGRTLKGSGNGHDNFYVAAMRGGQSCFVLDAQVDYDPDPFKMVLTTPSGTVSTESNADSMSITCQDGKTRTATGLQLLQILTCSRDYGDGTIMPWMPGLVASQSHLDIFPTPTSQPPTLTDCGCAPGVGCPSI